MKRINVSLRLALILGLILSFISCSSLLPSGQFGSNVLSAPPMPAKKAQATSLTVGASYLKGNLDATKNDVFALGKLGLLHTQRIGEKFVFLDLDAGVNLFGGAVKLYDSKDFIYTPSVERPFSFYGADIQGGIGGSIATSSDFLLSVGLQGGVAWEGGAFKTFRSDATRIMTSDKVWNVSPSGWSGYFAMNEAFTVWPVKNWGIRVNLITGFTDFDIPTSWGYGMFSEHSKAMATLGFFYQVSLSTIIKQWLVNLSFNSSVMNTGFSVSAGWATLIKDSKPLSVFPYVF